MVPAPTFTLFSDDGVTEVSQVVRLASRRPSSTLLQLDIVSNVHVTAQFRSPGADGHTGRCAVVAHLALLEHAVRKARPSERRRGSQSRNTHVRPDTHAVTQRHLAFEGGQLASMNTSRPTVSLAAHIDNAPGLPASRLPASARAHVRRAVQRFDFRELDLVVDAAGFGHSSARSTVVTLKSLLDRHGDDICQIVLAL